MTRYEFVPEPKMCCRSPKIVRARLHPFGRATYCKHCRDLRSDMSVLHEWLWILVLQFFWDGEVEVEDER